MGNNTIRINTKPDGSDKFLKVNLPQDFDFMEILSLKISQEEAYRKFCSDYGVIVGRVNINNGFGVSNAKVSVFIPIDDVDKNDPLISGFYPYETVTDKNSDGIRYNLLPKDGDMGNNCSTPIGSFPNKREVLDNETMLGVYCKYYKFTTTTNNAGDFMLFGVPLGQHTVHIDVDISDIGVASQRPYDLISQGTPEKFFQSPTKFNKNTNIDKLTQVKTMNVGVNVQPFWGDLENCEVGINRVDFDLNYNLIPSAIFMGSIFGDQDKNSISKRCRPRRDLGNLCEQKTGPGSVKMIRLTTDGDVENFDVGGGRVIDDDGTWAYQIPMNLDYMVTNELGQMVLSNDPNKGIPTRARVRFNIGIDENGGEGRLRTYARFLVPNNPKYQSEIDYSFDSKTKETSFRDLYWNKIYSVTNFISRFQTNGITLPDKTRAFTGIKDVDSCAGSKNPFPYNKVDVTLNPIFFVICLVVKLIAFIMWVMNKYIIFGINKVIEAINAILDFIRRMLQRVFDIVNTLLPKNKEIHLDPKNWTIGFIQCLVVQCPADDGARYAPGCQKNTHEWYVANGNNGNNGTFALDNYCGDGKHGCDINDYSVGLDNCIAAVMAEALNIYKFDFYNDWVNGSLFSFLLKYKKKKNNREAFCEYDCDTFISDPNYTGVDTNNNGTPDNDCRLNYLLDSCYQGGNDSQNKIKHVSIDEGLIKKVDDEFFYAATRHQNVNLKLFATDVICLGSIFDCDWQGVPKINGALVPTTYKIPPLVQEINEVDNTIETCGMINLDGDDDYLFFKINCLGVHAPYKGCLNIRHICEMGVDINESIDNANATCTIGTNEIDGDTGKFFRDVFYGLNITPYDGTTSPWIGANTNFNLINKGDYDFATINTNGVPSNGSEYVEFRGYTSQASYMQPKHSYFFYFGLIPGRTALDKMNQRYFTPCIPTFEDDLYIQTSTTVAVGATGSITLSFFGGVPQYEYTITGPNGPFTNTIDFTDTITGLVAGVYVITGVDSLENTVTKTVIVSPPSPLKCSVVKTQDSTTAGSNDGIITILAIGGGVSPYYYTLMKYDNTLVSGPIGPITTASLPIDLVGLSIDNAGSYQVLITDSNITPATCLTSQGLKIGGPGPLNVNVESITPVYCYGELTGSILLSINGGKQPMSSIYTTGPSSFTSDSLDMRDLEGGTYITTVVDAVGSSVSVTTVVPQPLGLLEVSLNSFGGRSSCTVGLYDLSLVVGGVADDALFDLWYYSDVLDDYVGPIQMSNTPPLRLEIPMANMNNYTKLYIEQVSPMTPQTSPVTICRSEEIQIDVSELTPPPTVDLVVSDGTLYQHCVPNVINFSIQLNNVDRGPYTVYTYIDSHTLIDTRQITPVAPYTDNDININTVGYSGELTIWVRVYDSYGCASLGTYIRPNNKIKLPTTAFTGYKVVDFPSGGLGNRTYIINVTGGSKVHVGNGFYGYEYKDQFGLWRGEAVNGNNEITINGPFTPFFILRDANLCEITVSTL